MEHASRKDVKNATRIFLTPTFARTHRGATQKKSPQDLLTWEAFWMKSGDTYSRTFGTTIGSESLTTMFGMVAVFLSVVRACATAIVVERDDHQRLNH